MQLFQIFLEWVDLHGLARDAAAWREFETLLNAYKNVPECWNQIYTYDTYNHGWFYLDGVKTKPFHKK